MEKIDSRLPLPNSIRCPALALFRKYNYPDRALIEAFKDETTKEHLNLISQVAVELKDDGTIKEYGRSTEPEHVKRRTNRAITGSEGNQSNLVISEGRKASENSSDSRGVQESTE
jgi:hypothetical protein